MQSTKVNQRFAVDIERNPELLINRLEFLFQRKPAGHVERIHPFGFCFRRDPNAFLFIATGSTFGLSLMFAEFAMRLHHAAPVAVFFSVCSLFGCLFCLWRFLRGLLYRFDVFAQQDELILRERLGPWVQSQRAYSSAQLVGVWVITDDLGTRVVLKGPRHAELGEVVRIQSLDSNFFAPWFAELVALVARHASSSLLPQQPQSSQSESAM